MYAALGGINEAIMRAGSPQELFQRICDAAVNGGEFLTAAVILPDRQTNWTSIAAVTGRVEQELRKARISIDEKTPEGQGLVGNAFRSREAGVSSDFLTDKRTDLWHTEARRAGVVAAAALPLIRNGSAIGVLLLYSSEKRAFDDEILKLLKRMAQNVVFALDNFEREEERRRGELALRANEEKYRDILKGIEDAYYEVDLKGDLVSVNPAFCRMLGYSEVELMGLNNRQYQTPEVATAVYKVFNRVYRTGEAEKGFDWVLICKDGSQVVGEGSVHLIKDAKGNSVGFRGMLRDVTARRRMERALRDSEERFRALTELSSDWYWEQDAQYRFVQASGNVMERSGLSPEDYLGKTLWALPFFNVPEELWAQHKAAIAARQPFHDLVLKTSGGEALRFVSISGRPILDDNGDFLGYRGTGKDITERTLDVERIQYLATHDGLTSLPNRVMFSRLLNFAIQQARRNERKLAVLFIDLDRFKVINDTLGHQAGDKLLQEISMRLSRTMRASDVVARLGGDEFVVLVQEVEEPLQVGWIARKIISVVMQPVSVLGQDCRVTASVGISTYPEDAQNEQGLMRNADAAMYAAKEGGKNNFEFYSPDMRAQSLERLVLENGLRQALEREEFFLHYQAKVSLRSGAITGVEALLRWQHPERGAIAPAKFISIAEVSGLIIPIGKWVLRTACAQNVAWQRAELSPVCIAVNLSPRQFADEHLLEELAEILETTGMDPQLLELEITESMVMVNIVRAAAQLNAIKRLGVRLAIDDFGTGYSMLSQLKRFPIDTLKVDRSFICNIPNDSKDKSITLAIIALGRSLGLTVVAEGVETQDQQSFLSQNACDEMQGFHFSRPLPPEEFADMLRRHVAVPQATAAEPIVP